MSIKKVMRRFGFDVVRYHSVFNTVLRHHNISTIIDIGANNGIWSLEMRHLFPTAQIYAFEPLRDCFERISIKFKNDQNFRPFNFALGDKNGTANIDRNAFHPSSSMLTMAKLHKELYPKSTKAMPQQIDVRRLDSIDEITLKPETLIKIDVQGYEDRVISGGENTLLKTKIVIVETSFVTLYENQPLFGDIHKQLNDLGFVYKGNCGVHFSSKTGEHIYEDSIFANKNLS